MSTTFPYLLIIFSSSAIWRRYFAQDGDKCDISVKYLCYLPGHVYSRINGRFYAKFVEVGGIYLLSSSQVDDVSLANYGYLVQKILTQLNPEVKVAMVNYEFRISIVGQSESFCDLPEIADNYYLAPGKPCSQPGAQGVIFKKLIIVSEGNGIDNCDYHNNSKSGRVLIHELTHAINLVIDQGMDGLRQDLDKAYASAKLHNLFDGIRDDSRVHYFTWGFMTYIEANECNPSGDVARQRLCRKQDLEIYDVELYRLIEEILPFTDWTYTCGSYCSKTTTKIQMCNSVRKV